MQLKCIIVDDEPPAHQVLENYISKVESLQLIKNCYKAADAINFLHQNSVDMIFLDIEMPDITGLEMIKTLENPPDIILTTAYSEFALESYELGVSDYLLKPIRFERFLKAVNRIIKKKTTILTQANQTVEKQTDYVFFKVDGVLHKILFSDISRIEACGNFVKIYNNSNYLLVSETMTEVLNSLPPLNFLRVHKSHIVNIYKISKIDGNQIFIDKIVVPIGNVYKQEVLQKLNIK